MVKIQSGESTGGDTDTDALKTIQDEIFIRHPLNKAYDHTTPVYVDPANPNHFFYLTAGMCQIWAKEKVRFLIEYFA